MNQKQIPLPSSRVDVEARRPRGKTVHEIDTSKEWLDAKALKDVFKSAKSKQESQFKNSSRLGLAFLQRAKQHAVLAAQCTEHEGKIKRLKRCEKMIEEVIKEWPVKIV